ncbi:MAG: hypothetical protein JRN39_02700 [Nitrososphaerota archaeon]|nr:hypothetical protein [Nitrososphaerota archaeon]
MTSFVFDTGALFYAEDERLRPLVDRVQAGRARGLLSSVTLSESYYKTCQKFGLDVAILWTRQLAERMEVVWPDLDLSISAGVEKCRNGRLSLANSYALALARRFNGVLLTTDSELAKTPKGRYLEV